MIYLLIHCLAEVHSTGVEKREAEKISVCSLEILVEGVLFSNRFSLDFTIGRIEPLTTDKNFLPINHFVLSLPKCCVIKIKCRSIFI